MKIKRICTFLILISILLGMLGGGFVYADEAPFAHFSSYSDYCTFAYDKAWPEDHRLYNSDVDVNLPDNFVYYEDISVFGLFESFTTYETDCDFYGYSLGDGLTPHMSIWVGHDSKNVLRQWLFMNRTGRFFV
jgi:hypothetical protein